MPLRFKKGDKLIATSVFNSDPTDEMRRAFEAGAVLEVMKTTESGYRCNSSFFNRNNEKGMWWYKDVDVELYKPSEEALIEMRNDKFLSDAEFLSRHRDMFKEVGS